MCDDIDSAIEEMENFLDDMEDVEEIVENQNVPEGEESAYYDSLFDKLNRGELDPPEDF